ncbi:MAG: M61 family metallopeptidase [Burkholderiales bacterium]
MKAPTRYTVRAARPEAHLFGVQCVVEAPDPDGQAFALPAWIPGSYMIREFAKHIVSIRAMTGKHPVALEKLDKHTWRAAPTSGPLTVEIEVFAHDHSVRGAFLDATRGFLNGPCLFLRVLGQEDHPCAIEFGPPAGARGRSWRLVTAMTPDRIDKQGFGTYRATDYDELIDHPVEMGTPAIATFRACGVAHTIAITGRHDTDLARLVRDMRRICVAQIRFFGEPAPMGRYVFFINAVPDGYGGLEHRASTALICGRNDLPRADMDKPTDEYRTFLGLVSHEYFHTWNVKRIKPAAFSPFDLDRENYTSLLWAFEGLTSYYDDLILARAGLISHKEYLTVIARNITGLARNPGRLRQSVAASSYDAWTKYYRQDENTPNAVVSYYLKGSLVGLCLDLEIRARTKHRKSLDHVMRALWAQYGQTGLGVPEDGIERAVEDVTGLRFRAFFDSSVHGTDELPLARVLKTVGIQMKMRQALSSTDRGGVAPNKESPGDAESSRRHRLVGLGMRTSIDGNEVKVTHVLEGSPAQAAGLAAGDVLVAIDGLRVNAKTYDAMVQRMRIGERAAVHAFRRDELSRFSLIAAGAPADTCDLIMPTARNAALDRWLGSAR